MQTADRIQNADYMQIQKFMEKLGAKCRLQSRFRMQTYILKLPLLSEKNLYNNLGEFLPKICSQQSSYYTDLMGFKWFCA